MGEPHAVYRHFDAMGRLLYVGCSMSVLLRTQSHKRNPWFYNIAKITIDWFPSVVAASVAEAAAILDEKPLHNKRGCHADMRKKATCTAPKPRWPSIPDDVVKAGADKWHMPDVFTWQAAIKVFHDAGFPWVTRATLNDNIGTRSAPKLKEGSQDG